MQTGSKLGCYNVPDEEGADQEKDSRPRHIHDYLLERRVTGGAPIDELGENGRFLQEKIKILFPEMVLFPFRISSHSSNPPLPYPSKNHAPISFSYADIAGCGFLIKISNLT